MFQKLWNKAKSFLPSSGSGSGSDSESAADAGRDTRDTITVIAKFKFLPEKKAEFVEILKGPDGLKVTRDFKGCLNVSCFDDADDENTLFLLQSWESREDHEAYLKMREETGLLEVLAPQLAEPLAPVYLNSDATI